MAKGLNLRPLPYLFQQLKVFSLTGSTLMTLFLLKYHDISLQKYVINLNCDYIFIVTMIVYSISRVFSIILPSIVWKLQSFASKFSSCEFGQIMNSE